MAEKPATILVINDHPTVRRWLCNFLAGQKYHCVEAATREQWLDQMSSRHVELILLDLEAPDFEGLETIRLLTQWRANPVLALCESQEERDIVAVLDAGAADCLVKPFGLGELAARIRSALRKVNGPDKASAATILVADLDINLKSKRVFRGGGEIVLTPTEFRLLVFLASHANKVVTQNQVLADLFGSDGQGRHGSVRTHLCSLRKKVSPNGSSGVLLQTIPGVGYLLAME